MSQLSDPKVVRQQIDALLKLAQEQTLNAQNLTAPINDPYVRQALNQLAGAVGILNTLMTIVLANFKIAGENDVPPTRRS